MKLWVAERDDLEVIYAMQKETFAPLYEKYQQIEGPCTFKNLLLNEFAT